ncbi:MAG: molybdate ABC transporter permease subunit [Burkholderiales bacterium]|nr:molybdate ABC transporter permease subunit [Burkholderiales bacterium]
MTPVEIEALRLSLEVAALATAVSLPLAVAVAYTLARVRFPGHAAVNALVHMPLVLPPVVVGYFLLLLFGTRGPIGHWLDATFGFRLIFTTQGAALASAVMSFPLMVRAIRLALDAVDPGLEQAARTLGAAPWDTFRSVTLPLMLPGVLSGAVVAFAASLGEFGATITFVSNIEGETRTLPLAIFTATQTPDGDAVAARLVAIAFALAVAMLVLAEWLARRVERAIGR